ncbi:MAG: hypothetical protein BVN35_08335 [Proteobacteria bacterium ST_bin11]|nr:MAG: hypothetical protein BVN35_08335 [Proteobacteria bacterium ST_bin11]
MDALWQLCALTIVPLREVSNEHVGKTFKCLVYEQAPVIHDTVVNVKKLMDKYVAFLSKCWALGSSGNPGWKVPYRIFVSLRTKRWLFIILR